MALLDVSELMTDPDLASKFQAQRSIETVDQHGRAQLAPGPIRTLTGVVVAASGRSMSMLPDGVHVENTISIFTQARLEGPSNTTGADTIFWQGNTYVVSVVNSYTNFGRGFIHAICTMKDLLANAPTNNISNRGP